MKERLIGLFEGRPNGPLFICIGGIHGNEPAGILAIQEMLRLLKVEIIQNPEFSYNGTFIGLRGNLPAINQMKRFIGRDLNRMLSTEDSARIRNTLYDDRTSEDIQALELTEAVESEIIRHPANTVLIIDLHTTTADGGIFTISSDDNMSRQIALSLHAPVILGISKGLKGTTIEYFNKPERNQYCIVFEAGQHKDPQSVYRAVAAIVSAMKFIGAVESSDVHIKHENLLVEESAGLPKLTRLISHYKIKDGENFKMNPGYKNFQSIAAGELVASNAEGPIYSPESGLILMPKYQLQGEDGFFIVKPVEN